MYYPVSVNYNELVCEDCGCIIETRREDMYMVDGNVYCECCFNDRYAYCNDCCDYYDIDNMRYDDDNGMLCLDCYRDRRKAIIHDHDFKPIPIFHGGTSCHRYFGVELEVDDGGYDDDHAAAVVDIAGSEDECYCKEDVSLRDGFEIVTHPMTLGYHERFFPWERITEYLSDNGYNSHDTDTCGLHIHVDRETFETGADARFAFMVQHFTPNMVQFSRRTFDKYMYWAGTYYNSTVDMSVSEWYQAAVAEDDRYHNVNVTNEHTIELRINRGTLCRDTIIASVQFVDALVNIANFCSDDDMHTLKWSTVCDYIELGDYPELKKYLVKRGLK